jgi:hypothetical protein
VVHHADGALVRSAQFTGAWGGSMALLRLEEAQDPLSPYFLIPHESVQVGMGGAAAMDRMTVSYLIILIPCSLSLSHHLR